MIFNGEMVRATLDSRKTQTRRPINPQPPDHLDEIQPILIGSCAVWQDNDGCRFEARSPYQVGDRLWVKETWAVSVGVMGSVVYKADGSGKPADGYKWRASIHMPKCIARLWLEVTGVRVEQLQEISEEDIRAEGVVVPRWNPDSVKEYPDPWKVYAEFWDSIYAKKHPWESSLWAWVYELRRIDG